MSNELEFLSRYVAKRQTEPARFSRPRRSARRLRNLRQLAAFKRGARRRSGQGRHRSRPACVGGESTNSLDPALMMTQVPFAFGKMLGRNDRRAVPRRQAREPHRRGDRLVRRRQDLDAQDPRRRRIPQRQDGDRRRRGRHARTPFRREVEVRRARLHEGHRDHQGQRQGSRPDAEGGQRRPALPAQRLSPDRPAERRQGQARCRHRRRPLQGHGQRARRAPWRRAFRQLLAGRQDGPCRPDRDHRHQRRDRAHRGAAGRPGQHDQPRRAEDRRPDQAACRASPSATMPGPATTSSSCIATRRRSTTTTSEWR